MALVTDHPDAGFVYCLTNSHMPGITKIGKTDRSPEERASELSKASGVPGAYNVAATWRVINASKAENAAHDALSSYRISGSENFKISARDAVRKLDTVLGHSSNSTITNSSGTAIQADELAARVFTQDWSTWLTALIIISFLVSPFAAWFVTQSFLVSIIAMFAIPSVLGAVGIVIIGVYAPATESMKVLTAFIGEATGGSAKKAKTLSRALAGNQNIQGALLTMIEGNAENPQLSESEQTILAELKLEGIDITPENLSSYLSNSAAANS